MSTRQNYIQWLVDNTSGIVTGQELPFGTVVVPWASSIGPVSNNIFVDPRNFGAKCTGWYGLQSATVFRAGTNFKVGDTFIAADEQIEGHMRGGVNATGHVTSINAQGGVTGFILDTPGSGYFLSALFVTPTSGQGLGFAINPSAIYSGPSMPSTSLASGGGALAQDNNGSYLPGGTYAVGDTFAVPNTLQNGNYMTGRVTGITTHGAVTSYVINNPGGDYIPVDTAPTITLTGFGSGLTLNINSSTSSNGTWDDTYGVIAAAIVANAVGGAVLIPNNTWVANLMLPSGTTLMGMGWGPNYGFSNIPSAILPSTNPHMFIIGTPNFGIDFNAQGDIALIGFEVRGYTGSNFGSNTTWDSTTGIGSFVGGGGGIGSKVWMYQMSVKACCVGLGSTNGTGGYIFAISQNSDYSTNQYGMYGPMSDFLTVGDTMASCNYGIRSSSSAGGLWRIIHPRIEYSNINAIELDAFGSLQCDIIGAQVDRAGFAGLYVNGTQQVNWTGGNLKGCGLAGTLTVTGTASGTGGVVRLTVSGFGSNPSGGNSATSGLVTGDVANVSGVVGTTEANGNQFTITVVDGSHIELQGTSFVHAYVSGGNVNVNAKGSYVVLNGSTDVHFANVGFYGYSAGAYIPAASIIDSTGSTNISFYGGTANIDPTASNNNGSFTQSFANWHNSGNTCSVGFNVNVTGYNDAALQTVVAGSGSGTATFSQPVQGYSNKEVLITCAALTGTASYVFPLPFTNTPAIVDTNSLATTVVTTLTAMGCTVTGSASTGTLRLIGW